MNLPYTLTISSFFPSDIYCDIVLNTFLYSLYIRAQVAPQTARSGKVHTGTSTVTYLPHTIGS